MTTHTITVEPVGREVECGEDQTILDACLRAGVWLPHSCTHGTCATCKVDTRDGEVDLGIGHTALLAGDFAGMRKLYHEVLGFQLSDRATRPFLAEFFHVNPRHHTLGLADAGTAAGVYHLMLEYLDWDDVGRAYDMALERPESIGVSLGRHANDHVTSFYLRTPDGWMLELGWAGRLIGADWQVAELPGMSLWGHDRTWLPPDKRAQARQILRDLAAQGLRAPVAVVEREKP